MERRGKIILGVGTGALLLSIFLLLTGRMYFGAESSTGWVDVVPTTLDISIGNLVLDNYGEVWFGESRRVVEKSGEAL